MEIKTYEQRVLFPALGMYLYNAKEGIICENPPVFLAKEAKESDWADITEEDKIRIEEEIAQKEQEERGEV